MEQTLSENLQLGQLVANALSEIERLGYSRPKVRVARYLPAVKSFPTTAAEVSCKEQIAGRAVGGAYRPCSPGYQNHTGVRGNRYARWL
jgi:hypothetical protein